MTNAVARARLLMPSPYESDGGELVGKDPKDLTKEDFDASGIPVLMPLRAVRAKCMDCCGENAAEVRKCVTFRCALWPMRMGRGTRHLRDVEKFPERGEE